MKKILALVLALALVLSCSAVLAEESSADVKKGVYHLINRTGESIVSVTIKDNVNGSEVPYDFKDNPLGVDDIFPITLEIPADQDGEHRLTLTFVTESGKTGTFSTLSIEEVSIELLDVDAVAGATPIKFGPAMKVGVYRIVNKTGAVVKSISITDPQTGNSKAVLFPFNPDEETVMIFAIDGSEDGNHRLTFSFTGEDGVERSFTTLSIEEATINLLAEDAMTGATPISFGPMVDPES